ncbi:NACHT, LRR and PYD domains-containing protein 3-like [Diadema antillarum]|uniref:NACHT, LRR and PYD domains-containing protein 3-like n=1 Tax=Diadema antillarum TaxID=105358 RepID=UPI003A8862B5
MIQAIAYLQCFSIIWKSSIVITYHGILNVISVRILACLLHFPEPALTRTQVKRCKKELKKYYRLLQGRVRVHSLDFTKVIRLDDIYTDLSLRNGNDMQNETMTYENLFTKSENGSLVQRLLIQGQGGVGKSTLCAKIAWDWCQGRILQDLDMVLLIPLRDVTDDKTIGDLIKKYLCDSNTVTSNQIDDYISNNPDKVLLILDGFDEFNGTLHENDNNEIIRILGLEKNKLCKVIVTTRPWRTDEFRMDKTLAKAYTFITIDGFSKENLPTYIRKYFKVKDKDNLAENLIAFMDKNDVIRLNVAPFPIYCAMLCLLWDEFSDKRKEQNSFSDVFQKMISLLKTHYASKFCKNLQTQNPTEYVQAAESAMQGISDIALSGLLVGNLSFPEEQFRKCAHAMKTCCRVGVLTIKRDVNSTQLWHEANNSSLIRSTVSFPHELFQEYIAGLYIGNLFSNDRAKYNDLKSKLLNRYEEFRYLLYFTSALRTELGLDVINDLKRTDEQYFCVDVAFESHTEEAARAVGERWQDYTLESSMLEHTKSGVVFMMQCNQVVSDIE